MMRKVGMERRASSPVNWLLHVLTCGSLLSSHIPTKKPKPAHKSVRATLSRARPPAPRDPQKFFGDKKNRSEETTKESLS